jgi:hypothetical protein
MAPKNPLPPPEKFRWKKGQSGNPKGRQAKTPAEKKLANLTRAELVEVGTLVVKGDLRKIVEMSKADNVPVLQAMVAAVAVNVIKKGDMHQLDVLLNRLIGKVPQPLAHSGIPAAQVTPPQTVILNIPSNGRERKKV